MKVTLFYKQPAYRQLAVFYLKIDKICFVMWRTRFIRGFLSRKILGKFATRETREHWVCFVYRIVVILGYCNILSVKLGSTYKEYDCWIQHPWNYIRRCRKGKFANFGKKIFLVVSMLPLALSIADWEIFQKILINKIYSVECSFVFILWQETLKKFRKCYDNFDFSEVSG